MAARPAKAAMPPAAARGRAERPDTRTGLLEAAERILIEEGFQALTTRRIGAVSSLNPTLVTYHFGTVAGLLAELCRRNLEPMLAAWKPLREGTATFASLRDVLDRWMTPLLQASAFARNGRALIVLDEVAAHGDPQLRDELLEIMLEISIAVQAAIRPFTPHLQPRELRARVRFLSAATLGPPPRTRIVRPERGEEPLDGSVYLINFAEAALSR